MRERRQPEIIAGTVNTDGTIARGDGFTSTRTGVGTYALTFAPGFRLVGIAFTGTANNSDTFYYDMVTGALTIRVSNTAVATDSGFTFVAVGAQQ